MSSVGRWSCTSPVWCDVDTTRLRKRTGPRSTGVNSIASGEALEHPVSGLAAEREVLLAAGRGDAEHGLVLVGAGAVDYLDERERVRRGAVALRRVGGASRGVEALARPAAVLRVGGGEVPVDLGEVDVEAPAGRRQLAPAADRAANGEDDHERDENAEDDCEPGRHAQ